MSRPDIPYIKQGAEFAYGFKRTESGIQLYLFHESREKPVVIGGINLTGVEEILKFLIREPEPAILFFPAQRYEYLGTEKQKSNFDESTPNVHRKDYEGVGFAWMNEEHLNDKEKLDYILALTKILEVQEGELSGPIDIFSLLWRFAHANGDQRRAAMDIAKRRSE